MGRGGGRWGGSPFLVRAQGQGGPPPAGGKPAAPVPAQPGFAPRVQEPVVLGRLAGRRSGRALAETDVEAGLEVVERVENPDASRGVDLRGALAAVAHAGRATAAGAELVGDARIHAVAVPRLW